MECGDGGRVVGEWWCWSVVMLVIALESVVLVLGVWRVVIVGGGDLLTIQHFNNTLAITYYELILLLDKLTLNLNQGNIVLNPVALCSKTYNCNG